jgi:O-antigen biosynthesis protein
MKIGYVVPPPTVSGGIRVILNHVWRLTERGHKAYLVSQNDGRPDWYPRQVPQMLGFTARDQSWDVLVATGWTTANLVSQWHRRVNVKAYFVQMWESEFYPPNSKDLRAQIERTYDLPFQYLTISPWLKNRIESKGHKNVPIIPNGVNTDIFYPDRTRESPVIRALVELSSGNYAKDPQNVAWRVVRSMPVERVLLTYNKVVGMQYKRMGWCHKAITTEDQNEVRQTYSNADILVKASRFEGRGCVPVEAMACGLPVAMAIGTGDDDLIDGYNCLKVKYSDVKGLRKAARRLMKDEDLRDELRENGLQYVKEKLNWDNIIPQLEQVYEDMLK